MKAGRAYRLVREVHLYSGLALLASLLIYTGTGLIMTYLHFFVQPVATQRSTVAMPPDLALSEPDISARVRRAAGIVGQEAPFLEEPDGAVVFRYGRPGVGLRVRWTPGEPTAVLTTTRTAPLTHLRQLHQLHGFRGGVRYLVWGILLDVVSIATILFALTGIYLWYVLKRDRFGWILLGGSCLYVAGSVVFLLLRR